MPRARPGKRKNRIQTSGLPKIFGGSLDDYYEATGEKVPLVVESCICAINLFGMKHLGIFRINGAHVRMLFILIITYCLKFSLRLISRNSKRHLKMEKTLLVA